MTNPILKAELHHQWYVIEKSRSGRLWILLALVMLLPAILTTIWLYIGGMFFNLRFNGVPGFLFGGVDLLSIGLVMLLIMNIAMSIVVTMISFGLATNSIVREKRGKTWDNLILTNVNARTLVFGKWMASMYALYGDHLLVGVLRLGMAAWAITGFTDRLPADTLSIPVHLVLLSILIVVYTLIDAALNTALGLSVMLVDRASAFTASAFLLLRGITVIYSLWLFVSVIQRMFDTSGFTYFSHGLLGLAVYAVVTLIVLWAAQQNAVRYAHVSA
jgi:hypothetical protein